MTPEEQHEMLQMIKDVKKINEQKTDLMEELILLARTVAQQNEVLEKENLMLKEQLRIAEREIMRQAVTDIESQS